MIAVLPLRELRRAHDGLKLAPLPGRSRRQLLREVPLGPPGLANREVRRIPPCIFLAPPRLQTDRSTLVAFAVSTAANNPRRSQKSQSPARYPVLIRTRWISHGFLVSARDGPPSPSTMDPINLRSVLEA